VAESKEGRLVILALLPMAFAHPMGSGSTNRSALLVVSERGTRLRYLVDFAEDPSVAEMARIDASDKDAYASARIAELSRGIALTVDGANVALTVNKCLPSVGQGEGARPVVLLVCELVGPTLPAGRIRLEDHNFDGLPGWREMFVTGDGVAVSDVRPAGAGATDVMPMPFSRAPEEMMLTTVEATITDPRGWPALSAQSSSGQVQTK
jgi:hypothetical protein